MGLFNLRLNPNQKHKIEIEAERRGLSKSDIVREAIEKYVCVDLSDEQTRETLEDDWGDFGQAVITQHEKILNNMISQLHEEDNIWQKYVEPLYALMTGKIIEKSRAYTNPSIYTNNSSSPHEPCVSMYIALAADHGHAINVSLEQLFFEYGWHAGMEAFDEIPQVWEQAKVRLDKGEKDPSHEEMVKTRQIYPRDSKPDADTQPKGEPKP